jgi:hypothetical protein
MILYVNKCESITSTIVETEDSATELKRHVQKEKLKNGNPIIVHELGQSQRYTKCS